MIADFLLWPHDWTADSDAGRLRENLRTWGGNLILICFDMDMDADIHIVKISLIIFGQVTVRACLFMFRASHKLGLPQSLVNSSLYFKFSLHFYVWQSHKSPICYIFKLLSRTHSSFDQEFVSLTNINQTSRPAISINQLAFLQVLSLTICFSRHQSIEIMIADDKWFGQSINVISVTMTQCSQREWDNLKQAYPGSHSSCLMLLSRRLWPGQVMQWPAHSGAGHQHCLAKNDKTNFFLLSMTKHFGQNTPIVTNLIPNEQVIKWKGVCCEGDPLSLADFRTLALAC